MNRGSKGESFNDIIKSLLKATEPQPVKVSSEIINELKKADIAYENGECISFTKKEFLEKF
ncbi:MAG: hypothetical protein Q4Q23_07220 [Methanobacteriaceae archaeon]|nr:hypothetical protein [Methanobacteriaceae archaeon]